MKNFKNSWRNVATIAACLAVTMMTSCGGGSSNKGVAQSGDSKKTEVKAVAKSGGNVATQVKSINTSNWQVVVKAVFGIDVVLPDGWTVKTATSNNDKSDVFLKFIPSEKSEYTAFATTVFNLTKVISKKQMQKSRGDAAVNSFDEAKIDSELASWKYFYGDESASNGTVTVIVNVEYDDTIVLQLD